MKIFINILLVFMSGCGRMAFAQTFEPSSAYTNAQVRETERRLFHLEGLRHTFDALEDVPSYTGNAGKAAAVKSTEDGIEFIDYAKVRADSDDTTPGFLSDKVDGSSIIITAGDKLQASADKGSFLSGSLDTSSSSYVAVDSETITDVPAGTYLIVCDISAHGYYNPYPFAGYASVRVVANGSTVYSFNTNPDNDVDNFRTTVIHTEASDVASFVFKVEVKCTNTGPVGVSSMSVYMIRLY